MTIKKWLGFFIGMIGIWYMITPSSSAFCCYDISYQYLMMLVSVVSCSLGWVLVRKLLQKGYQPFHINGLAMLMGGIMAMICSYALEPSAQLPWQNMQQFLLLLFSIIMLSNVIFYNLYGYLLRHYSATLLAFVGFITPLFTAFYDWLILDITVDYHFYIATSIVAYGIYVFYQEELRQGYVR
jgi:drug/metabolite transporter (DMT)-like permease